MDPERGREARDGRSCRRDLEAALAGAVAGLGSRVDVGCEDRTHIELMAPGDEQVFADEHLGCAYVEIDGGCACVLAVSVLRVRLVAHVCS